MTPILGRMEQDGARFHHTTQNGVQFKTYELLISGIFHLLFLDRGWPHVTETTESETADKGGPPYFPTFLRLAGYHKSFSRPEVGGS